MEIPGQNLKPEEMEHKQMINNDTVGWLTLLSLQVISCSQTGQTDELALIGTYPPTTGNY